MSTHPEQVPLEEWLLPARTSSGWRAGGWLDIASAGFLHVNLQGGEAHALALQSWLIQASPPVFSLLRRAHPSVLTGHPGNSTEKTRGLGIEMSAMVALHQPWEMTVPRPMSLSAL